MPENQTALLLRPGTHTLAVTAHGGFFMRRAMSKKNVMWLVTCARVVWRARVGIGMQLARANIGERVRFVCVARC